MRRRYEPRHIIAPSHEGEYRELRKNQNLHALLSACEALVENWECGECNVDRYVFLIEEALTALGRRGGDD